MFNQVVKRSFVIVVQQRSDFKVGVLKSGSESIVFSFDSRDVKNVPNIGKKEEILMEIVSFRVCLCI